MSWKEIGHCYKVHGIKGELVLQLNGYGQFLKDQTPVLLRPLSTQSQLSVAGEEFIMNKLRGSHKIIASLEQIDNRDSAEQIVPFSLFVDEQYLPKPSQNFYLASDLVGFVLVNAQGKEAGKVESAYHNGAHDILTISIDQQWLDLPLNENFFKEIDFAHKKIIYTEPEII